MVRNDPENTAAEKEGTSELMPWIPYLKVCGMKANTEEVSTVAPDYLGFIFWEPSPRYFDGEIPFLDTDTKKVGVFVDATIEEIIGKVVKYNLQLIQLHGEESPEFCRKLREDLYDAPPRIPEMKTGRGQILTGPDKTAGYEQIIKVFSIKDDFDFSVLEPYEEVCDFYLFDTKGKLPGGNGYGFDWTLLKNYPSNKPYFLSGGIGLEEIDKIQEFLTTKAGKRCYAIDINSKFEIAPGLKDIEKLKEFKNALTQE